MNAWITRSIRIRTSRSILRRKKNESRRMNQEQFDKEILELKNKVLEEQIMRLEAEKKVLKSENLRKKNEFTITTNPYRYLKSPYYEPDTYDADMLKLFEKWESRQEMPSVLLGKLTGAGFQRAALPKADPAEEAGPI